MGSFSKTLQQTKTEPVSPPVGDQQTEHKRPELWEDPRPDLTEDHHLWRRLLKASHNLPDEQEAYKVTGVLNGIRCGGTLIVRGNGGYVLRPLIDPKRGWSSQEEYEAMRDKYLKPHLQSIKVLLQVLKQDFW